jgi:uncharacterized protein with GYD domain
MPKYMFHGGYTAQGAAGLMKEGGSGRMEAVKNLVASLGGTLESFYWAFGKEDFYIVAEMPDAHAAAAISLTVGATGAAEVTTSELMTAADVDDVAHRHANYRAPGA